MCKDFCNQDHNELLLHWRTYLAGAPMLLELPVDHPRSSTQHYCGDVLTFPMAQELSAALYQFSQHEKVKLATILMAAFQILLARYSGREDFLLGMLVDKQARIADVGLIGPFAKTLVLHCNLVDNPTFCQFLHGVSANLQADDTQYALPLELLREVLPSEHDAGHPPLIQVLFMAKEAPASAAELPDPSVQFNETDILPPGLDLALVVREREGGVEGAFAYDRALFEPATIARLQAHFLQLLWSILQNPDQGIAALSFLTADEEQGLLQEFKHTQSVGADLPAYTFHQLFEAQVLRSPQAVAASFEDTEYTYAQLNARANQFARFLRPLGVGPEVVVALCIERSLDMLVALLGIFKAGGAYLPLDPTYPVERLTFMLEDAEAPVLVTQQAFIQLFPAYRGQQVCFDREQEHISALPQENLDLSMQDTQLAYMIYTSGSTDRPKGVQIEQRSLVNFLCAMCQEPGISAQDRLLAVTTLSFDIAGLELYLPLLVGARVVIASRMVVSDGNALAVLLKQAGITIMQATPITWRILIASGWEGDPALKALCGGEALPLELAQQLLPKVQALYNMYGPTETTIWSLLRKIEPTDPAISIGHPIARTSVYVLDRHFHPVPLGVVGELCIGGTGLARGYWKRPELLAERFIQLCIAGQEQRLYRTGDLARYRSDGTLELIGRLDQQVKVRGYRIELGEIETMLDRHATVAQAIVGVREDGTGDQRLVAYILPHPGAPVDVAVLRQHLQQALPVYMLPADYMILDTFPLTPNGKVDRRALMALAFSPMQATEEVKPRTVVEELVLQIWVQVLKRSHIGIHDDFFDIGGHSLLATQVLVRLRRTFRMHIDLQQVFAERTVAQLATMLVSHEPRPGHVETIARIHQQISKLSADDVRAHLASNTNISHSNSK